MALDTFIPELWSARFQAHLDKAHVAKAFVNTDYEGEIKKMGDTVHVNSLGRVTVKDYTKAAIADPEELTATDQTLNIDKAKYFNFMIDSVDKAQAAGTIMDEAMSGAAYETADDIDTVVFATIAAGAGIKIGADTAVALTADNVYKNIVAIRTAMNKKNVSRTGRKLAVSPDITGLLLLDDRFVKAGVPEAEKRLEEGFVGRVAGFDVYESNNLPDGKLIASVPTATSFAEQIVEIDAYKPEKRFGDAVKGLDVYGVKVFQADEVAVLNYTLA